MLPANQGRRERPRLIPACVPLRGNDLLVPLVDLSASRVRRCAQSVPCCQIRGLIRCVLAQSLTHFSGLWFERGFRLMMRRRLVKRLGWCPLFAKIALGTSSNVPNDAVVPVLTRALYGALGRVGHRGQNMLARITRSTKAATAAPANCTIPVPAIASTYREVRRPAGYPVTAKNVLRLGYRCDGRIRRSIWSADPNGAECLRIPHKRMRV